MSSFSVTIVERDIDRTTIKNKLVVLPRVASLFLEISFMQPTTKPAQRKRKQTTLNPTSHTSIIATYQVRMGTPLLLTHAAYIRYPEQDTRYTRK